MNNHMLWMVLGCVLPLLFIFLAPWMGIGDGSSLFLFIIFMFAIHLFIPHGGHKQKGHDHSAKKDFDDEKDPAGIMSKDGQKQNRAPRHH